MVIQKDLKRLQLKLQTRYLSLVRQGFQMTLLPFQWGQEHHDYQTLQIHPA